MARQNRVTPFGRIIADPAHGLFMGNRGCLHDADGQIRRPYAGRRWICCLTRFKDRRRALMQPGHYTELFFLDEAVAFSAGHRPCAECRREAYRAFCTAWGTAGLPDGQSADGIDRHLHQARLSPARPRPGASLPDGTFIDLAGRACLIMGDALLPWRPDGYGAPLPRPRGNLLPLTPAPLIAALVAGYRPQLHPSAHSAA